MRACVARFWWAVRSHELKVSWNEENSVTERKIAIYNRACGQMQETGVRAFSRENGEKHISLFSDSRGQEPAGQRRVSNLISEWRAFVLILNCYAELFSCCLLNVISNNWNQSNKGFTGGWAGAVIGYCNIIFIPCKLIMLFLYFTFFVLKNKQTKIIWRSGTSDPYCIVKVDNEVVARWVFFLFFLIIPKSKSSAG